MDDGLPLNGLIYNNINDESASQNANIILAGDVDINNENPYDSLGDIAEDMKKASEQFPEKTVGGVIRAVNMLYYPFGENRFVDIIDIYAERAFALLRGGAKFIFVRGITSVADCRAAVLGVRQTELPIILEVSPNPSFELENGTSVSSALIVSQALGAHSFCINFADEDLATENIEEISPYSMIPLLLNTDYNNLTARQLMDMSKYCYPCVNASSVSDESLGKINKVFDKRFGSRYTYKDMQAILSATEYEPFFLDEMFEISPAIRLDEFDEDILLELENSKYDVIGIHILDEEDVFNFAEHAHLFTRPVAFSCDDALLLEKVLIIYMGRAFINSAYCEIDDEQLAQIARGYGAILR